MEIIRAEATRPAGRPRVTSAEHACKTTCPVAWAARTGNDSRDLTCTRQGYDKAREEATDQLAQALAQVQGAEQEASAAQAEQVKPSCCGHCNTWAHCHT